MRYLKEYRRNTYLNLLTSGKRNSYLASIDPQAQKRLETLIEQMKQTTEQLKADNVLDWVQCMNNIRACAMEIVNKKIIYVYQVGGRAFYSAAY